MKLIWELAYNISDDDIEKKISEFEGIHNIIVPNLYKDILRKKRQRCLTPEIMVKNFKNAYERENIRLATFNLNTMTLFEINERNLDIKPENIVFFAYDSGGNYYGFDFKENPNDPKIVYYNHELVPPKEDLIADGFVGNEIEEEQRKYYKTVYDNFEDLYKHLELGQKYWIEEEFGNEDSEEFKDFLASDWTY